MKPLVQRSFLTSDIPAALALWQDTPGVGLNDSDTPPRLTQFLQRNPGFSRVVTDDDRLVGAILCGHDGRRGYLHHLAVDPAYRGRGIGRSLVEDCLGHLRRYGIQKCNAMLFDDNDEGESFWLRQGWSPRSDLVVMQCELTREPVA